MRGAAEALRDVVKSRRVMGIGVGSIVLFPCFSLSTQSEHNIFVTLHRPRILLC